MYCSVKVSCPLHLLHLPYQQNREKEPTVRGWSQVSQDTPLDWATKQCVGHSMAALTELNQTKQTTVYNVYNSNIMSCPAFFVLSPGPSSVDWCGPDLWCGGILHFCMTATHTHPLRIFLLRRWNSWDFCEFCGSLLLEDDFDGFPLLSPGLGCVRGLHCWAVWASFSEQSHLPPSTNLRRSCSTLISAVFDLVKSLQSRVYKTTWSRWTRWAGSTSSHQLLIKDIFEGCVDAGWFQETHGRCV